MIENSQYDKKSLKTLTKRNPNWDEIAKDCVAFANAYGGRLVFGIEDKDENPPLHQIIPKDIIPKLVKNIQGRTLNVSIIPKVITYENGAEVLEILVQRTSSTVACTSKGRYYIRVEDDCKPVLPDELTRLISDKSAFVWETQNYLKIPISDCDNKKLQNFINDIKKSERVSSFVKEKTTEELLEYYFFTEGNTLTNLGVLWIGKRIHRAKLLYAPSAQYIKYDELDRKVNKIVWDDFSLNPKEMIEDIWQKIPDWKEGLEITDGLFRRNIANYDEVVVRELLANAFVHRPYTIRGDIFINLYVNHLEIHNPGMFPLGVTSQNILHKSVQRNVHLAKVFYDLQLMEKEGSGYDKIYATLLSMGKPLPEPNEIRDRVQVRIEKRIIKSEVILFMEKANKEYQLKTKETISLGLIAQNTSLTAIEFSKVLDLKEPNAVRDWLGRLIELELVKQKGKTKGTTYYVEPALLKRLEYKGQTDLKNIEPHRLRELILADLSIYKSSSFSEIHKRIGEEIPKRSIRSQIDNLIKNNQLEKEGERRGTKYFIDEKL